MKKKKRDYKENQKKVTIYREKQNRESWELGARTEVLSPQARPLRN